MDILKGIAGAGAVFGILWMAVVVLYALFPFIVMIQLHRIIRNGESSNKLTRQLLRAYGHEPEA